MLPPPMIANAQSTGTTVEPGARGFGFNADATMLVRSRSRVPRSTCETELARHADPDGHFSAAKDGTRPASAGRRCGGVAADGAGPASFGLDGATTPTTRCAGGQLASFAAAAAGRAGRADRGCPGSRSPPAGLVRRNAGPVGGRSGTRQHHRERKSRVGSFATLLGFDIYGSTPRTLLAGGGPRRHGCSSTSGRGT